MRIVVLPGDGIGPEIAAATSAVLRAASERFQLGVTLEERAVGHASLEQFGTTVRPELLDIVRSARDVGGTTARKRPARRSWIS
jgi:3-isopropylmalate dehydrogenase